jgi:hypothetical protein
MSKTADPDGRRVFRSPSAVAIWWLWVLFAVGNLIDLVIQGRDHVSVVAACSLLAVTGVVYVTALRPKIVAEADGLMIVNPVRVHRVGWAAIAGFDTTDLLRVGCEWPAESGTAADRLPEIGTPEGGLPPGWSAQDGLPGTGTVTKKRTIHSWAVRSSRRGQIAAEARAKRQAARGRGGGRVGLGLTERAETARAAAPDARAVPPLSDWDWPSVAAVVFPALALLIAVLA